MTRPAGAPSAMHSEKINRPAVQRVFLGAMALVTQAAAPLSESKRLALCGSSGMVGLAAMLATKLGASAAALIEPIVDGIFASGSSVEFWAATGRFFLAWPRDRDSTIVAVALLTIIDRISRRICAT